MTYDDELSDEQCMYYRRLPCSFNDMVRAIYKAGQEAAEVRRLREVEK
jgi:hypothetical protein